MRVVLALLLMLSAAAVHAETPSTAWRKWGPSLFDRAAREDKYILLNMAAVWCHWCHVMEDTTYADPAIQRKIAERFIPVRVDQDSDPALSYCYESWGWPATVMLDKDGNEIFKRCDYIPPELFAKLLVAVIENPSALPGVATAAPADPDANRRAPNGGFGHARAADDDTHLGDTLAVAEGARGVLARPVKQIDENVAAVRLFNRPAHDTGKPAYRADAEHGMRWLVALAEDDLVLPGALLAGRELGREPAHVTIVGAKDDPAARALYAAARRYPTRYPRIEWLDRREGALPNADVDYPELPEAAAFACANGACSVPLYEAADVHRIIAKVDDR